MGWQGNTIRKGAKRPENRVTRFPVEEVPRSGKGGGERSEPITECLSCHVIQKANPVTLSFLLEVAKELDS